MRPAKAPAVFVTKLEADKFDAAKPPLGLISRIALEEEAKVMAFGVAKYGTHNWRKGMDFSRLGDAALRRGMGVFALHRNGAVAGRGGRRRGRGWRPVSMPCRCPL